jgi:hypothetical protein
LEHFKKSQGNLEFHQNKCHTGDVRDTRRQCAKDTDQWAQGVAGRPAFESVWTKTSWTRVYTRRERLWWCRKSVEAKLIGWPAMWLGRPVTTWHVTASAKSVELPHGPINTPLPVKVDTHTHTTFWRFHLKSSHS